MLTRLSKIFKEINAYLVGASVRDMILGAKPQKIEVVARCLPHKLLEIGATPISRQAEFPVFSFYNEFLGNIQITLPRGAKGAVDACCNPYLSIEEDLATRDFTINAIAIDIHTGSRIDPFAGYADLTCGLLRHVSGKFFTNPLGVFQAYRLCTKGLTLAPETRALIKRIGIDEFAGIPAERVYDELIEAMAGEHPARFFTEMVTTGGGLTVFGEVFFMARIPAGPPEFHGDESILEHSVEILKRVAVMTPDPIFRLSAFFHDVGKVLSPMAEWPHHYGHDVAGANTIETRFRALKAPVEVIQAVSAVCALHMKAQKWDQMRSGAALDLASSAHNSGVDRILPLVVKADTGRDMRGWDAALEISGLSASHLGIESEWIDGHNDEQVQALVLQRRAELFKGVLAAA